MNRVPPSVSSSTTRVTASAPILHRILLHRSAMCAATSAVMQYRQWQDLLQRGERIISGRSRLSRMASQRRPRLTPPRSPPPEDCGKPPAAPLDAPALYRDFSA